MCQAKSQGGQRCEYSDMLSVVRRKARRQNKDASLRERERAVEKAVRSWQESNPKIVAAHLPEKQPFQVKANKKPVPEELRNMLTKSKDPVTGFPEDQRLEHTKAMFEEREEWMEDMSLEEENAVEQYTLSSFDPVNAMARRKGYAAWKRSHGYTDNEDEEEEIDQETRTTIWDLDAAIDSAPEPEEPRKLYRFFRVPAGVSPTEYMKRYFKDGEGFKDAGFMSTTADPEFIMAHMENRNKGNRNKGYIVMEMISKRGASLQPLEESRGGHIQSLEKEVLLPRNTKFRVVESRRSQKFAFASDRDDLHEQYHPHNERQMRYREGDEMRFPVIQMIDEDLITEHHREHKK